METEIFNYFDGLIDDLMKEYRQDLTDSDDRENYIKVGALEALTELKRRMGE